MDIRDTKEYQEMGYAVVSCPVCGCETLDSHWICEHCGWEYDGITEEDRFSAANGVTIEGYRLRRQIQQLLQAKKTGVRKSYSETVSFIPHPKYIIVTKKELRRQMPNFNDPDNLLQVLVFGENHPKFEEYLTKVCIKLQTASSFLYRRGKEAGKLSEQEYEGYLFNQRCENLVECYDRLEGIFEREGLDPQQAISEELIRKVFEKFCAVKRYTLPMIANTTEYAYFSFFRHVILFVVEHDYYPEAKINSSYRYPDLPGMSECDIDFDY